MIGRVILAVLLAGVTAGLCMGAIQHVRLTPLILEAEVFEKAGEAHHEATAPAAATEAAPAGTDASQAVAHDHGEAEEWAPEDGFERSLDTTVASAVAGAGFAAILAGISLLAGIPITTRNGAIWGLCGFLAVTLAPAAGLPPELPGMPAGDLLARQIWWFSTIAATGLGIYLFAARRELWALAAGVVLIALPHIIGAPQPPSHESGVPAGLSAEFAANSIAANAVFWIVIGLAVGYAMSRVSKELQTT